MMKEKQLKCKELISSVDKALPLVLLVVVFFALDFYSHPHRGVADEERRQFLLSLPLIKLIANHLGNYSFSAALAISAVGAKHILQKINDSKIFQEVVRHGFLASISSIVVFNALIESFRGNNEPVRDFSMGLFAIATAVAATESTIKKVKLAKKAKNNSTEK